MKTILYTKNNCPQCSLIKTMFEAMEVEYGTINIDENPEAKDLIVSKRFMAAPILQVEDEFIGVLDLIKKKALELI